jgi:hypothetical protein
VNRLEEFFTNTWTRKNKRNLRNLGSIVNLIVNQLHVVRWDLLKRRHVDHTKIVISKFAFLIFLIILLIC